MIRDVTSVLILGLGGVGYIYVLHLSQNRFWVRTKCRALRLAHYKVYLDQAKERRISSLNTDLSNERPYILQVTIGNVLLTNINKTSYITDAVVVIDGDDDRLTSYKHTVICQHEQRHQWLTTDYNHILPWRSGVDRNVSYNNYWSGSIFSPQIQKLIFLHFMKIYESI